MTDTLPGNSSIPFPSRMRAYPVTPSLFDLGERWPWHRSTRQLTSGNTCPGTAEGCTCSATVAHMHSGMHCHCVWLPSNSSPPHSPSSAPAGIQQVDALRWLLKAEPTEVYAAGTNGTGAADDINAYEALSLT